MVNIYNYVDLQDGLNKGNMDKLTFLAGNSPEKLDRIGEYLAHRMKRDISKQRVGYMRICCIIVCSPKNML